MIIDFSRMKLNWTTKIVGEKVILVPYCQKHVEKYHQWMKNEELQDLTGSEPLTLEQEYEMQKTWRDSDDKCTFIILHKETFFRENDENKAMIGDTNIFLRREDSEELIGEAEIMIAEKGFRGQKLGWEAMHLMLMYGVQELKIEAFEAKIKTHNKPSIAMFEKMKFVETSRSDIFQEVTLTKRVDLDWTKYLLNECNGHKIEQYDQITD